jgi:hypothetical protein
MCGHGRGLADVPAGLGAGAELAAAEQTAVEALEELGVEIARRHRPEGRLEIDADQVGVALGGAGLVAGDSVQCSSSSSTVTPERGRRFSFDLWSRMIAFSASRPVGADSRMRRSRPVRDPHRLYHGMLLAA